MQRFRWGRMALLMFVLLPSGSLPLKLTAHAETVETIRHCLRLAPTYQAVWRPGTTQETLLVAASWDQFLAKDRELRLQGWRLHQIHTDVGYSCDGATIIWTFDVLWRLEGNIEEFAVFAWKWSDFVNKGLSEIKVFHPIVRYLQ